MVIFKNRIFRLLATGLLFCNSFAAASAAEEKPKVAVLDFKAVGDSPDLGEGAAEILRTTLIETGKYIIIERGMLRQVLEEQKLSASGIVDPQEAAGIGKILGAKLVAVGSVVKMGESYTLNVRFVDAETGEVVSGRNLTAGNKEDIPALCGQIVKLLSGGPESTQTEEVPAPLPAQTPYEKEPVEKTEAAPPAGNWSLGVVYPGAALKYVRRDHAWELKVQSGSGVLAAGPRYYRYLTNSGLRLFWGLEADFISFKGEESKGSGFAAGGFGGGEISLGGNLSLSMDLGPMFISLSEKDYSQSESGMEYLVNMGIYWYFR